MARRKYWVGYLNERVLSEAKHLIITSSTISKTATFSGYSKSTVYRDLTVLLPKLNAELAREVRYVLDSNKEKSYIKSKKRNNN